jgi:hypothetical protein
MKHLLVTLIAAIVAPVVAAPSPVHTGWGREAAGAVVDRQPLLEQDLRLQKAVTLRLNRRPLSAVTAELGRQAGVQIRASLDVADEPVILFLTDRPVREVMHRLASLLGYRWRRTGPAGQYEYEIFQDMRSKQEEAALRLLPQRRAVDAVRAELRRCLDLAQQPAEALHREATVHEAALGQLEQMSADQRAEIMETSQYRTLQERAECAQRLHEMADPLRRILAGAASLLTPPQWYALVEGETVCFSTLREPGTVPLPPALARALRDATPQALPSGTRWLGPVTPDDEASYRLEEGRMQQAFAHGSDFRVAMRLSLTSGTGSPVPSRWVAATLTVVPAAMAPAGSQGDLVPGPPLTVTGQWQSTAEVRGSTDASVSTADKSLPAGTRRFVSLASTAARQGCGTVSVNELLPAMAESYGIDLIADAYRAAPIPLPDLPTGGEWTVREVLDRWVRPVARWSWDGAFLQVRRRDWAAARHAEIPERVVKRWAAHLQKSSRVSLEDAVALALSLRDEQLAEFEAVMRDEGIHVSLHFEEEVGETTLKHRDFLRGYGSLLPGQRQLLQVGRGVACRAMTPEARRWLRPLETAWREPFRARLSGTASAGVLLLVIRQYERDGAGRASGFLAIEDVPRQLQFAYETGQGESIPLPLLLPSVERANPLSDGPHEWRHP